VTTNYLSPMFRFAVSLLLSGAVLAQEPAPVAVPEETPLDEVVVTGEFPGPGMWQVTHPRHEGHVLWIVGDPWPLPKRMKWKSKRIEAVALEAQEILRDSSVSMTTDEKIGVFRGITLIPAMLEARKNPDDARLEDLLPPDLYARWLVQKKRYLGRESGVERWRPLFAADRLRKATFDELGMRERGAVWEVLDDLVKEHKLKVNSPVIKFTFKRSEVRSKIKEFSRESLEDVECFSATLALSEALSDQEVETARARAWAAGDIPALSALPVLPNPYLPCAMAVMKAQVASSVIPPDLPRKSQDLWLDTVEKSLASNSVTLAVVSFPKLTRADGYLDALRARGFGIQAPQ
jgi:hypothetical protein